MQYSYFIISRVFFSILSSRFKKHNRLTVIRIFLIRHHIVKLRCNVVTGHVMYNVSYIFDTYLPANAIASTQIGITCTILSGNRAHIERKPSHFYPTLTSISAV